MLRMICRIGRPLQDGTVVLRASVMEIGYDPQPTAEISAESVEKEDDAWSYISVTPL